MALEGQQLGRYRLQNLLGGGGMGEVYLAEDVHIRRQVAVKVIRAEVAAYPDPEAAKESARLFRREIRAIALLDHPHILPLYDYGEENFNNMALTYMVMPLRMGGSLATWFQQRGGASKLSLQDIAYFIHQAASALQYAHRHHIVHQDVKPSNFLIRVDEEEGGLPDLQLADFGIAKLFTATSSMSQTSRGTPAFMAPEQWSGNPVPATDQYALATMAYQLLTGNPPFQGRPEQVMFQHFQVQPPPPSKLNARVPTEIDAVILRALAKKPEERFARIIDFARAFQQAIQPPPAPNTATVARIAPPGPSPLPPQEGLRATLAISEEEARTGTVRTLTLPGGRKVQVQVPSQVKDGHIIRLEGQGEPTKRGTTGPLLINITVKRPEDERVPAMPGHSEGTVRASSGKPAFTPPPPPPLAPPAITRNNTRPPKRLTIGKLSAQQTALLVAGILLLFLLSGVSMFYFRYDNILQRNALLSASIPNPYTHSGILALNDPLRDNSNGYSWYEDSDGGGSCSFTTGFYDIKEINDLSIHYCVAKPIFSNFVFEVQMTLQQGYGGGIVFRSNYSIDSYYYFGVNNDKTYNLKIFQSHSYAGAIASDTLTNVDTSPGKQILLAVIANGNTITMYVNHQQVASVQDSTYSQGQVGVAAEDVSGPTEVAFSNARVWTL